MNLSPADYLVHLSNILLLIAYSVRDILWLRWFAVAAALINIPYYLVQGDILWPPVFWAVVFMVINLFQIARIYWERRPVVLNADEQALYKMGFTELRPREFVSLLLTGEWRSANAGDAILRQGDPVANVCIAVSGEVKLQRQAHDLGSVGPGQVIGTALALVGGPSPIDATFVNPGRYMCWPVANLRTFLDKRPELRTAIQGMVSRDLARKIEHLASRHINAS
jgi:Popeye-like protein